MKWIDLKRRYTMTDEKVFDASGNNFVIIQKPTKADYSKLAVSLCQRYQTDGLIIVLKPTDSQVAQHKVDFVWQFYNRDGSTASMCGNGTRAVAKYYHRYISQKSHIAFLTDVGVIDTEVHGDIVQTTMPKEMELKVPFDIDGLTWWKVDTGVPHMVAVVEDIENFDIFKIRQIRQKYEANVNIVKLISKEYIKVRTYERGVEDETLACGTGMVACFLWLEKLELVGSETKVSPRSKKDIDIKREDGKIYFKGEVYEQKID